MLVASCTPAASECEFTIRCLEGRRCKKQMSVSHSHQMECDMNDYYCINELFQERRHSVFKLILLPLKIHYMERPFTEDQRQSISFKGCYAVFQIGLSPRQKISCKYVKWEVFTVVYVKLTAFWNVMRCCLECK
jgi:hypothetical protein